MKVAFPYMGTTVIYKKLLELLGHEVIEPPEPTQRTIDLGVKYSPEFACFPLKVVLGSYIEAVEMGAETIVTSGGHGPCRAGFYGETHKKILKNLGYDVDIIVFDAYKRDKMGTIKRVLKVKNGKSWITVWKAINVVYAMAKALDRIEKRIEKMRAYEVHKGECTKAWKTIKEWFDHDVKTIKDVEMTEMKSHKLLDEIKLVEVPEEEKIRIGIVGEIYVVMEQSINLRIEETLGNLGAEVERSQYLSEWIDYNIMPGAARKEHELYILKKGEKYIEEIIGGHAKQTVGHIVDYAERGFDGVIHLMPFACLPELVSQSIIPTIGKEHNIPVLTLSIDEQTGTANTLTRLEAFIDLIRNNKRTKTA
ncbi:2-hydroxyacyl-CoA dehydratase [Lutispora thermophila]|uniref:Predicted nucleotide-binding protein, sugar kinase/HSP70/actin superfamily n=1 Tax=Lutispora thermophila DSM 19022 TaxID=1122184 RepID=A0A1M6B1Z1_9FIRM|nr:2-hydroxyacyl-CoA dehydratase [Lutispora thermophila]SHI42726.1 Predicted nucleotide-binding protein, sugar kinase/HSP70/actin superfamily [Lutispora thermophila DSM 19022]